jgi:flagellar hook-associated protein 3 FlgL
MRVTTSMIAGNLIARLAQTTERIYQLQGQIASGKRVLRPSDDPTAAARARSLHSDLAQIGRYADNVSYATNLLQDLDGTLSAIANVVRDARDIAVQAANPTLTQNQPVALAAQVDQLIGRLVSLGNTQRDGRYIFAGHRTLTQPFAASGSPPPPVDYSGDSGQMQIEVAQGETVVANITGDTLFNAGGAANPALDDLFTTLTHLRDEILAGDANAVSARLADLDAHLSRVLELRAEVGGRVNRLQLSADRLDNMRISLSEMASKAEDADLARAVVDLQTQQNIYQATAASAAQIGQLTLLDFLR